MASNVSTVDGMGFEEVNQSSYTDMISGLSGCFTLLNTTTAYLDNKELKSTLLGSETTNIWGGFIQAGSLLTSAGSVGFVKFGTPYTSATSYYVVATSCGSVASYEKSYISGARNASGVNFVGAASARYDWIAVGN